MYRSTLFIPLSLMLASTSYAQPGGPNDSSELEISLGFAAFTEQSPYLDGERRNEAAPYLELSWGPLYFNGDTLGLFLYGGDNWGIATTLSYDMFGDTERGNSDTLKDMGELDDVYNAALVFFHESQLGEVSVEVATDISNEHNGERAVFSYALPVVFGRWTLTPEVGADWFSEEISQYYVGISRAHVKAGRPFYQPSAGFNYNAGLTLEFQLGRHHRFIGNLNRRFFSDEVSNSPIVSDSASTSAVVGYLYRF